MNKPIRILGIAGSLRKSSYNRGTLQAATELVPEGASIEVFELGGIPCHVARALPVPHDP